MILNILDVSLLNQLAIIVVRVFVIIFNKITFPRTFCRFNESRPYRNSCRQYHPLSRASDLLATKEHPQEVVLKKAAT